MTQPTRSRPLRTLIALVIAGALTPLAGLAASPASAEGDDPGPCADVLFVSMRGSGQTRDNTPEMDRVRDGFTTKVAAWNDPWNPSVEVHSLDYQAEPVETAYVNLPGFLSSIDGGIDLLGSYLSAAKVICPSQAIVLAGYSQGAMVVQQYISSAGVDPTILNRIVGVGLVASGDRAGGVWNVREELGTAKNRGLGIRRSSLLLHVDTPIPEDFKKRTYSLCDRGDVICDYTYSSFTLGGTIHGNNYQGLNSMALGEKLADLALGASYIKDATYNVSAKNYSSITLPISTYAGGPAKLELVSGAAPAGMRLNKANGYIDGTPKQPGTSVITFRVRGQNPKVWIPATITIVVGPAVQGAKTTVHFTGTVTTLWNRHGGAPSGLEEGATVTGSYTYRTDTTDTWQPTDPRGSEYRYDKAPYGATLQLGSATIGTSYSRKDGQPSFSIGVTHGIDMWADNTYDPETFYWGVTDPVSSDGAPILEFGWSSYGPHDPQGSDALPTGPINLDAYDQNRIIIDSCSEYREDNDGACWTGFTAFIDVTSTTM